MSPYAFLVAAIVRIEQALEQVPSEHTEGLCRIRRDLTALAVTINRPGTRDADAFAESGLYFVRKLGISLEDIESAVDVAMERKARGTPHEFGDATLGEVASTFSKDVVELLLDAANKSSDTNDIAFWERISALQAVRETDANADE